MSNRLVMRATSSSIGCIEPTRSQFIGRVPVFAFGNSDGDHQMLQWTAAGGGALHGHRPSHGCGSRSTLAAVNPSAEPLLDSQSVHHFAGKCVCTQATYLSIQPCRNLRVSSLAMSPASVKNPFVT